LWVDRQLAAEFDPAVGDERRAAFAQLWISPRAFCVLVHAAQGQHTQMELAKLADYRLTGAGGPGSSMR
jgi:hypothetical protein